MSDLVVVLLDDYRCAPEGHTTVRHLRGQRVTGRVAEMALRDGVGELEKEPAPKTARKPLGPNKKKPAAPKATKEPR
jgi:hypothetical protein